MSKTDIIISSQVFEKPMKGDHFMNTYTKKAQIAPSLVTLPAIHPQLSIKDPWSAITHFIGIVASLVAAPFLLSHLQEKGADAMTIFGAVIFLLGMLLLYTASTVYHSVISARWDTLLRKMDHMMIFILIAASYTPFCLTTLREGCGRILLLVVWGSALAGMFMKFCWITCPKWVSSVTYILLGWACVFAIPGLWQNLSPAGFLFLLMGGIFYTVGGVFYALRLPAFNQKHPSFGSHEIFHVMVLIGNALQFICVYAYLV